MRILLLIFITLSAMQPAPLAINSQSAVKFAYRKRNAFQIRYIEDKIKEEYVRSKKLRRTLSDIHMLMIYKGVTSIPGGN